MFYWVEAGHSSGVLQPGERFMGHIVLDNQGFQGFNRGRGETARESITTLCPGQQVCRVSSRAVNELSQRFTLKAPFSTEAS